MQLGENPDRSVKIEFGLSPEVRSMLIEFLQANSDLFVFSQREMPGSDPQVACHKLNLDANVWYMTQYRRNQSPEKEDAIENRMKYILDVMFISEATYTKLLSNVILVKKASGKWRICINYTDIN